MLQAAACRPALVAQRCHRRIAPARLTRSLGMPFAAEQHQQQQQPMAASANGAAASRAADAAAPAADAHAADPSDLWACIVRRYDEAQASSAASTTATSTQLVEDGGVRFVLRVAAMLRNKPIMPTDSTSKAAREWRNPFLPYDEALWVGHLSGSHTLLLNKFNLVAHHVLVVTRAFQPQTDPLGEADVAATLAVLRAMPAGGLAFYNRGPRSGASQPHKHVQVMPLPVNEAAPPGEDPPIWPAVRAALADAQPYAPVQVRTLPFAAFAAALPADGPPMPAELAAACDALVAAAQAWVDAHTPAGAASADPEGLSYNLLLTDRFVAVVPRSAEVDGPVGCNSVAVVGSFFVKSSEELEYVREHGPLRILTRVGFAWD